MNAQLSGTRRAADTIPFFSELPPKAVKAACKLWDAIQSPGYNGVAAYVAFVHNLELHGIDAPPRATVKRWAAGVECGLIPRPEPEEEAPALPAPTPEIVTEPDVKAEAERVKAKAGKRTVKAETQVADVLVSYPGTGEPVRPEIVAEIDAETRMVGNVEVRFDEAETPVRPDRSAEEAIDAAVEQLVQEIIVEMMADIEQEARQRAADRLVQRAVRMRVKLDALHPPDKETIRNIIEDFGRDAAVRAGASVEEVDAIAREVFGGSP